MDVQDSRQRKVLQGIELRYMLTVNLDIHGEASIFALIEQLYYQGFSIPGRPSKTVSDALRWEMRRGRVRRLRRGVYGPRADAAINRAVHPQPSRRVTR